MINPEYPMPDTNHILFIGDSLTEWFDLEGFFPEISITNEGIAGDTTYGVLERVEDIPLQDYSKIFLMIGINDIFNGFLREDIVENIELIIENLQTYASQSKLFVQSLLPVNESAIGTHYGLNTLINGINDDIKDHCEARHVSYLDLHKHFLSDQEMKREYTTDGAHLSATGYHLWAEKIEAFLY
ncbi:MAG TPA: GDSL-type esterase/lipase family protein [Bacteroidales bacterium]|nr:GDSL-type esterase/lipase family protein [Bacteroidales bacterium]